ncbi:transposase [Ensifer sp. CCNWLY38]|uniref:transposase n=1 Tax=unclassified Ensifer TaxID=2633371 RepID=UPI003FA5F641
MARFDLKDRAWALIAPLLPNKPRGVARTDDRRILNAIFYGAQATVARPSGTYART